MFVVIGGSIALGYSGLLPEVASEAAISVGFPAFVATILLDTFLFNTFLIDTGVMVWGILAGFVYLEAVAVGVLARVYRSYKAHSPRPH